MKKSSRILLAIAFVCYLVVLMMILFYRPAYQRGDQSLFDYIGIATNLHPFQTIYDYVRGFVNGQVAFRYLFANIFGNLLLFMPLILFLEYYFEKLRDICWLIPLSVGGLFAVETTQLLTQTGSFDVDDVILNLAGILIAHAVSYKIRKSDGTEKSASEL